MNKKNAIILLQLIVLISYLIWEIYWFNKVGYYAIKWHTHLMPYAYLVFGLYIMHHWNLHKKLPKVFQLLVSITIFLSFLELLLLLTGKTKTSAEKSFGSYISPFKSTFATDYYYHVWDKSTPTHELTTPEFSFTYPTNSLGFPDEEWKTDKTDNNSIRILTLGDSFTEGDGANYDSNYVAHLKRMLVNDSIKFEVLNAGVCGSDPVYNYMNLKDRLLPYKPDVVIQMISSPDITYDMAMRGGLERYENDRILLDKPPWWELIYASSYTSRILFGMLGYGEHLMKKGKSDENTNEKLITLFEEYSAFCIKNNIMLILVIRPEVDEVKMNKYAFNFSPLIQSLSVHNNNKVVDLLPFYQSYMKQNGLKPEELFWKKDRHHNTKGYKMLADGIYSFLKTISMDSTRVQQN